MTKMRLDSINIKESFANSVPRKEKMEECRKYWEENHSQDRFLVIDHTNTLIDGYIQYLVLQENNIKDAEVKISDKPDIRWSRKDSTKIVPKSVTEEITYIHGKHLTGPGTKEYIWRIPKTWKWLAANVRIGDNIVCNTRYGQSSVVVTRVETCKRIRNLKVKKVAAKEIVRNGEVIRKGI